MLIVTTFTFGDASNIYEADVSRAILEVRMEGHGKIGLKKSLIFPKLVFIHNENKHGKGNEFEWLFELSLKCSSKCMYPDYIGQGHTREGKVVSPMGCRAYLSNYRDKDTGELVFEGRFNLGAISLNLPMILRKSQVENIDFYETLEYYLQIIRCLHIKRFEYVGRAKASSNPLMFCQGGAYKGFLNPEDRIKPILESATISFGITALNETSILYNGKSILEDKSFSIDVLDFINKKVDEFKKKDEILYAIYSTPSESLCGTQIRQFRNKYGIIKGVSDKEYFTNSFHAWVGEDINPMQKQDAEEEAFHKSTGGHIQYVRISNPNNTKALRSIVERGLKKGFYQGINFNACNCNQCGNTGNDFGDTCPSCGSQDVNEINRTCGYLGYSRKNGDRTFNDAKMCEIKDRKSM